MTLDLTHLSNPGRPLKRTEATLLGAAMGQDSLVVDAYGAYALHHHSYTKVQPCRALLKRLLQILGIRLDRVSEQVSSSPRRGLNCSRKRHPNMYRESVKSKNLGRVTENNDKPVQCPQDSTPSTPGI